MRIMITGGAGFIGSNLILYWLKKHPEDQLYNVDNLTYAANLNYLAEVAINPNYKFMKCDIVQREQVREVIKDIVPQGVIHLAAESHVDNSILGPEAFVLTNVVGTFNLLEECRQLWSHKEFSLNKPRFHHVSTDEVYGTLGKEGYFSEDSSYNPRSPYSASKASSDHLVKSYFYTYDMNVVISNCCNNFGQNQHKEKLIPTVIKNAIDMKPIPVYGQGENIRDWIFVEDHCKAIDVIFHHGTSGNNYNVGGENEWRNIDIINKICEILNELIGKGPQGDYKNLITFVADRLGHDYRYAIDPKKIQNELNWKADKSFDDAIRDTIKFYLEDRL